MLPSSYMILASQLMVEGKSDAAYRVIHKEMRRFGINVDVSAARMRGGSVWLY